MSQGEFYLIFHSVIELIIIAICLFLNAVLSCIEMAFVTVSKPYVKQLANTGSKPAARLLGMKNNPERALSVLQVGITLVGIISAAVSGAGAEEVIGPKLSQFFSLNKDNGELLAIAITVIPLTFISVVVGELVPKSIALRFPLKLALLGGHLLVLMDKIFAPFVFLLEISTKFFTRFLFAKFKPERLVDPAREVDLEPLTEAHKQYVFNLIDVNKKSVKDIMIPWEQAARISYSDHHFEVLEKIKSSRHTRLPVLRHEEVIGLLHTKEFISEAEIAKLDWTTLIRTILFLSPTEPILTALKKFQQSKSHLAVVKKDNVPVGVVTIEDIFEEVVGDIYDEDDDPRTLLSANSRIRKMDLPKNPGQL